MHNAGFIVVDRDDKPATPPEKAEHLLRDADRIRVCALNYFIEPARERGASNVAIRASDLAQAMGLRDAFPNICQVLGGDKFQHLAKVPAPTYTEPNPSSSTTFTYQLGSRAEPTTVTEAIPIKSPSATNLILYGPPGTGKTYRTALEAVRLCLGDNVTAEFENDRDALMTEYRRLVNDGRIEFTTFHQSFSYEEFVEGLRPSAGEAETNTPEEVRSGGGFDLKLHDGIFKRISERARLDQGDDDHAQHLDRSQGLFKLSLIGSDWRDQLASAMNQRQISWGFGAGTDWSAPEFEDFQSIKQLWLESNPGTDGRSADISGTWYFRGAVDVGSYVLLTVGKNRIVALGRIAGDYEFHPHAGDRQHTRKVDWIWGDERGADRSSFYPQTFSAFQPMYQLAPDKIDWDALEEIAFQNKTRSTTPAGQRGAEQPLGDGYGPSDTQSLAEDGIHLEPLVDLDKLDLDEEPQGELFTVGKLPPVRSSTFRHLAQDVAKQMAERYPQGFALNQYRDALVKSGKMAAIEPMGGWENHNMPSWASHPAQGWLVPKAEASETSRRGGGMPSINVSDENRASKGSEKPSNQYVLIIDEINRANISKVFGELITLLEQDKRLGAQNEVRVQLPYSKKPFGVPSNLHIIGTMNTADRSIALLDTALRRRFSFQELMPDPKVLSENVGGINLRKLLFTINERVEYLFDREHQIGHAYFTGCRRRSDVEEVMRHKVIPLLAEYFYEDWSKVAAVLGDGPATSRKHFLEASSLPPPNGMSEDDLNVAKLRWSVKPEFDFSEFEAS
ncbi:MAG: AAA family ATPase [Rhodobacterales bacterium]|nr:AAA family ATPase [Rhodobacterales bacterium]